MENNKPNKAAIYCRTSADPGAFEPENADSLAYQAGSAMAFIQDNGLTFSGLYTLTRLDIAHWKPSYGILLREQSIR